MDVFDLQKTFRVKLSFEQNNEVHVHDASSNLNFQRCKEIIENSFTKRSVKVVFVPPPQSLMESPDISEAAQLSSNPTISNRNIEAKPACQIDYEKKPKLTKLKFYHRCCEQTKGETSNIKMRHWVLPLSNGKIAVISSQFRISFYTLKGKHICTTQKPPIDETPHTFSFSAIKDNTFCLKLTKKNDYHSNYSQYFQYSLRQTYSGQFVVDLNKVYLDPITRNAWDEKISDSMEKHEIADLTINTDTPMFHTRTPITEENVQKVLADPYQRDIYVWKHPTTQERAKVVWYNEASIIEYDTATYSLYFFDADNKPSKTIKPLDLGKSPRGLESNFEHSHTLIEGRSKDKYGHGGNRYHVPIAFTDTLHNNTRYLFVVYTWGLRIFKEAQEGEQIKFEHIQDAPGLHDVADSFNTYTNTNYYNGSISFHDGRMYFVPSPKKIIFPIPNEAQPLNLGILSFRDDDAPH